VLPLTNLQPLYPTIDSPITRLFLVQVGFDRRALEGGSQSSGRRFVLLGRIRLGRVMLALNQTVASSKELRVRHF